MYCVFNLHGFVEWYLKVLKRFLKMWQSFCFERTSSYSFTLTKGFCSKHQNLVFSIFGKVHLLPMNFFHIVQNCLHNPLFFHIITSWCFHVSLIICLLLFCMLQCCSLSSPISKYLIHKNSQVSLCCDKNINDIVSTRKMPSENTGHGEGFLVFFHFKWRHSYFYHSAETQKLFSICFIK